MTMLDDGVMDLMTARRELDKAHKAACAAMARFQAVKCADIMSADERVAARSLLDQTVPLCKAILAALQAVPAIAGNRGQESGVRGQRTDDGGQKTAAWMLNRRRENRGTVATSARFGKPILTAMVIAIVVSCPLSVVRGDTVEKVIDALVVIESSGRPAAIGDGGKAVGLLQIHAVAVREANRLAGSNRWKLSDRFCPQKSRAMARTILTWHYRRGTTDPVELACRWNKPFGQPTAHYRAKVRAELSKI